MHFDPSKMSVKDEDGAVSQDDKKKPLFCLNRGNVFAFIVAQMLFIIIFTYSKAGPTNHLWQSVVENTTWVVLESKQSSSGKRILTRNSDTANSTARPSCFVGVHYDISRKKICRWLINHFYVIGHESY